MVLTGSVLPEVSTPLYWRDNIHVSLLAKAYADFAVEVAQSKRSAHRTPSSYVENQGAFAERFAAKATLAGQLRLRYFRSRRSVVRGPQDFSRATGSRTKVPDHYAGRPRGRRSRAVLIHEGHREGDRGRPTKGHREADRGRSMQHIAEAIETGR